MSIPVRKQLLPGENPLELVQSVAVYDVEDKKLVLLFSSPMNCRKYMGLATTTDIKDIIVNKRKSKNKNFKRLVCYRYANTEQLKILGKEPFVCLDDRFKTILTFKLRTQF